TSPYAVEGLRGVDATRWTGREVLVREHARRRRLELDVDGFAEEVERDVLHDPVEPGEEAALAVEAVEVAKGAKEGLLDDLLGVVLVPQEAERHGEGSWAMGFDELAEGPLVTLPGIADEGAFLLGVDSVGGT